VAALLMAVLETFASLRMENDGHGNDPKEEGYSHEATVGIEVKG